MRTGTAIVQDTGAKSNMNRRGRDGRHFDPAAATTKPGLGRGLAQFDLSNVADRALIHRAIRGRWKLSRRQRRNIIHCLVYVVTHSPDVRSKISAANAVITAAGQNMADLHRLEKSRRATADGRAQADHGLP